MGGGLCAFRQPLPQNRQLENLSSGNKQLGFLLPIEKKIIQTLAEIINNITERGIGLEKVRQWIFVAASYKMVNPELL